jgi:hypothetical protein
MNTYLVYDQKGFALKSGMYLNPQPCTPVARIPVKVSNFGYELREVAGDSGEI